MRIFLFSLLVIGMPLAGMPAPQLPSLSMAATLSKKLTAAQEKLKSMSSATLKKVKTIFSEDNQHKMVGAYVLIGLVETIIELFQLSPGMSTPMTVLPSSIASALKDMNISKDSVKFVIAPDSSRFIAAATATGTIYINKKDFDIFSPKEQRWIIGHELTHIFKHHHLKKLVGTIAIFALTPLLLKEQYEITKKFVSYVTNRYQITNNSTADKILSAVQTTSKAIAESPLIKFLLIQSFLAAQTRYYERDADTNSAIKLKASGDGINCYKRAIANRQKWQEEIHWLNWLNPIFLKNKFERNIGWHTHAPAEEAIQYLGKLKSPALAA